MFSTNPNNNIYLIGSIINEMESVLVRDSKASILLHFDSFEDAKQSFNHIYKTLLSPSFQPSTPPSQEEVLYHKEFMRLINFRPMILQINKDTCARQLIEWKDDQSPIFTTERKLFNIEYWHCQMKPGFLKKFCVLDIFRDIESTPFIGPDGKMVVRKSNISYPGDDDLPTGIHNN